MLWPGYEVPSLLQPITSSTKTGNSREQFFVEQTVPTSMMISILAFGLTNAKRNLPFRALTAGGLIGLTRALCQFGELELTTTPIGQSRSFKWSVSADATFPLACFIQSRAERADFVESWGWDAKAGFADKT